MSYPSYSLRSLRGTLLRPHSPRGTGRQERTRLFLDVTRFGMGYWIGAVSSTLMSIDVPMLIWIDKNHRLLATALFAILATIAYCLILAMLAGVVLTIIHLYQGLRNRDRDAILGGLLGFLLCAWPFLLLIASLFGIALDFGLKSR